MIRTLEDLIAKLVPTIHPSEIVLFGSRSTGTSNADSDLDVLVVADLPGKRHERETRVHRLLRPRALPIDVLVYTPAEVARLDADEDSFVHQILRTGKVVYAAENG